MRVEQVVARKVVEKVRANKVLVGVFDSADNEFGQVSNEEVMEFSFVVRDHEYIDVMRSISMLRRIEREELFIFKREDIDADRRVNFLKFQNICMFERKVKVGNIRSLKYWR